MTLGASCTRLLLEFVQGRDIPCPACRYNVRDLTAAVCPECGSTLRLQVGTPTPHFGLILLLMGPLVAVAGIGLFFGIVILIQGPPPTGFWGLYAVLLLACADIAGCIIIYRIRHLYMRRDQKVQVALVLLSWVFHVLVLFVSFKSIF